MATVKDEIMNSTDKYAVIAQAIIIAGEDVARALRAVADSLDRIETYTGAHEIAESLQNVAAMIDLNKGK